MKVSIEDIKKESFQMVKLEGYDKFSLRKLANNLSIKPSSLYNHINGIEDIYLFLIEDISLDIKNYLNDRFYSNPKEELIYLVNKYIDYSNVNKNLYEAYIKIPKNDVARKKSHSAYDMFKDVIKKFNIKKENRIHFLRILRSNLDGFIEVKNNGFMNEEKFLLSNTLDIMIDNLYKLLERLEKNEI